MSSQRPTRSTLARFAPAVALAVSVPLGACSPDGPFDHRAELPQPERPRARDTRAALVEVRIVAGGEGAEATCTVGGEAPAPGERVRLVFENGAADARSLRVPAVGVETRALGPGQREILRFDAPGGAADLDASCFNEGGEPAGSAVLRFRTGDGSGATAGTGSGTGDGSGAASSPEN